MYYPPPKDAKFKEIKHNNRLQRIENTHNKEKKTLDNKEEYEEITVLSYNSINHRNSFLLMFCVKDKYSHRINPTNQIPL